VSHRPALIVFALFVSTAAFALDPTRAITQSRLTAWTNGLPQTTINTTSRLGCYQFF